MENMDICQENAPLKDDASSSRGMVEQLPKEVDDDISALVDLHPLLIDHFVQNMMTFFNVKDLKSARLVCKLWAAEAGEQLLIKSHLSPKFNSSELTEKALLKFLSLSKPSANFKLFCGSRDILNFLKWFPKVVERISELKYLSDARYEMDAQFQLCKLAKALEKLTNLKILDTNDLSFQPPPRNTELDQFYDKLESLEEIRLPFPLSTDLRERGARLKNVSKITLDDPSNLTRNFLLSDQVQWPLTHVTLKLREFSLYTSLLLSRLFFIKISNTLKHLEIEVPEKLFPVYQQNPWEDDWLIPVDLPFLETMIINGSDEHIWPLLTVALRLPRLRKLVLAHVPEGVNKKIQQWEKHRLARGKKLQSLTIEEVELNRSFHSCSSAVFEGNLWPNLKSLTVNMNEFTFSHGSVFLTPHLFSFWEGLERLELNIPSVLSPRESELYQKWLRGAELRCDSHYDALVVKESYASWNFPCSKLSDLKNLKCLTLRLPPQLMFEDELIYYCLGWMTKLQSLRFNYKSVLSTEALNYLNKVLGDIVSFVGQD